MPQNNLVYLDCEATHLDTRIADTIETAWAVNGGPIKVLRFPHTLDSADPEALRVNCYHERDYGNPATWAYPEDVEVLRRDLSGATIVAENYGYDLALLLRKLGHEPWHHRKVELSSVAMTVFNLDRPEGMAKTADRLRGFGFDVPVPDHSAGGDVACLRACYTALRVIRDEGYVGRPF